MKKSKLRFWIFLAPALISFTIIVLIPTLIGFFYSLTDWNGIVGSDIEFVGFQNFIDIFTRDDSFLHAFGFTALFSICAVILVNLVGFALALLVTQKFKGATLLRGIFFMPNLIGGLLLGFTWQFIFVSRRLPKRPGGNFSADGSPMRRQVLSACSSLRYGSYPDI